MFTVTLRSIVRSNDSVKTYDNVVCGIKIVSSNTLSALEETFRQTHDISFLEIESLRCENYYIHTSDPNLVILIHRLPTIAEIKAGWY